MVMILSLFMGILHIFEMMLRSFSGKAEWADSCRHPVHAKTPLMCGFSLKRIHQRRYVWDMELSNDEKKESANTLANAVRHLPSNRF